MTMRRVDDMPTNYWAAQTLLANRDERTIANNTRLRRHPVEPGVIELVLHATAIVRWTPDTVTLNSGGWRTVTTKARMNAALHGTRYRVEQRDHAWYLHDRVTGATFDFEDGDTWNLDDDHVARGPGDDLEDIGR